ncbi:phage/plasmid primase, P4 family [Microvirga sp. KLBC 81]|uniref:phage/plasmid primase, P4 family n=1 Tax=Microvirga sp. KLBC 81 TaxID=1862707 RepID=UPI001FE135D0|nr:phage/plasmid primase, P4 family [Microvirga sp. KLBC 81]
MAAGSIVQHVAAQTGEIDDGTITQDAVARAFADRQEDRLRYCHSMGAWYFWTGAYWQKDETDRTFQLVRELAREFSEGSRPKDLKEVRKVGFAAGVERFARGDPIFAVTAEAWDQDPLLLGTPDGTVDLRSGVLRASTPQEGLTKITTVAPSDAADCPSWLKFLDEATGGDIELIRFLQQWCGYALTGLIREHALVFVYGPGGNGKSVFLTVLTGILGDYAATAAMDTFTASHTDKHTTDLAMLRGARLVTASETEEDRPWAEARIKQMTGGDPITARFMRQDNFTFRPQFKLTIVGNHQPNLRNVDDAARRRFNIVPFIIKPAHPDRNLDEKLKAEWPAILRWMIDGCLDWQKNGLTRPQSVRDATDTYFSEQDLFGQWLQEETDAEPDNKNKLGTSAALYKSWSDFAMRSGEKPGSQKAFAAEMRKRGFEAFRTGSLGRGFRGIRLRTLTHHSDGSDAW